MKQFILYSWILFLMVMMTGCSKDDAGAVDSAQSPIEFTTDGPALFITRSVIENNSHLQAAGFGVLAYMKGTNGATACYDGENIWNEGAPNFMYNQQVTWNNTNSNWTYSPVKYWPNDNNSADGSGATGSQDHSYVSFFAYAPYCATPDPEAASGITALSLNNVTTAPTISYKWAADADLLYDAKPDCYKTDINGSGSMSGAVQFSFKHALAQVKFKVRRTPGSSLAVTLKSLIISGFYTSGTFNLGAKTPSWSSTGSGSKTFDPTPDMTVTKETEATAQEIGSMLIIPGSSLSYTIRYSIAGTEYLHEDISLVPSPISSFQMGYQYTIIFTIDGEGVIVDTTKYTEQW